MWAVVSMLACAGPVAEAPSVQLVPRSRSVTNDGKPLAIDVVNDGGAGTLTLRASLGIVTPSAFPLAAHAAQTVAFSCDLASLPTCLGQAVLSADTVDSHGAHVFASTVVQVVETAPGFVPATDGGCDGSQVGPLADCCWTPALSTTAPQCGWVAEPGNADFALLVAQSDGGVTSANFDFRVPTQWADPANCVSFHPGFGVTPVAATLAFPCAGYGVDFVTGAWSPLAFGSCLAGDDFFASAVCPRLGGFAAAAFALTVPGRDGGVTVFTVMPR